MKRMHGIAGYTNRCVSLFFNTSLIVFMMYVEMYLHSELLALK